MLIQVLLIGQEPSANLITVFTSNLHLSLIPLYFLLFLLIFLLIIQLHSMPFDISLTLLHGYSLESLRVTFMILFKELNVGIIANFAFFFLFHKLVCKAQPLINLDKLVDLLRWLNKRLGMSLVCVLHWNRVWIANLLLAYVYKFRMVIFGNLTGFLLMEYVYFFKSAILLAPIFIIFTHEWDRLAAHEWIFERRPGLLFADLSLFPIHHVLLKVLVWKIEILRY